MINETRRMLQWRLNSVLHNARETPVVFTGQDFVRETGYGQLWQNWDEARQLLNQWDEQGFLRVLADPKVAASDAASDADTNLVCLELNYYIENKGTRAEFRKDVQDRLRSK